MVVNIITRNIMQYRRLGRTEANISALSLGCGPIGSSETDYGVKIIRRALELGVNYIDVARSYWDSEIKVGIALRGNRDKVFLSTKTTAGRAASLTTLTCFLISARSMR